MFQIKHRWNGSVVFECELSAEVAGKEYSLQLGFAVKKAAEGGANLVNASLADANLAGANLVNASLADASLAGANLAGASLVNANLAGASLVNANLAGANLAGANLADANLVNANLAHAYLAGAYLAGANLADANLADAYLAGAYLADANLADAYLAGANLAGANLAGANLADAKWCNGIVLKRAPLYVHGLTWTVVILDDHMQIGCELHCLDEWAAFDDVRIARMGAHTARKFWDRHRVALLALAASDGRGVLAPTDVKGEALS